VNENVPQPIADRDDLLAVWCGNLFTGPDAQCSECPRGREEAQRRR